MNFLNNLSLRNRFLIAPLIGITLTLILYFASNAIIQSHTNLFQQLNEANLPQASEVNHASVLLTQNHLKLTDLLHAAEEDLDEEQIYLHGRIILNELHKIEGRLTQIYDPRKNIIIGQVNISEQIKQAFDDYRNATISAIELSTVNPRFAHNELHSANTMLQQLNNIFLILSKHHSTNLTEQSKLLEISLYDKNTVSILTIALVLAMILSALFFSKRMSFDLDKINQALIGLSKKETNIQLPDHGDQYLQKLTTAVYTFKQTLRRNTDQQNILNSTIEELKNSKERYFSLLDLTATAIIAVNETQDIVLFNKAAERTFGYDSHEIIGQSLGQLMPEQYRHQHEINVKNFKDSDVAFIPAMKREPVKALKKNGEQFFVEASIAKLTQANESLMTVAVTDITKRKEAEEQILHQAHFDALTNLPNRFLALDRLSQLLNESQRKDELVAILFLDLDDFKKVNDSLGHETGDKLLIEAAKRLNSAIRGGDTVGRLGGDEFIIILPGLTEASDARPVIENLIEQFRNAFKVDGRELILTASIGISVSPEDGDNASELLRNADSAMYHAKNQGRNTYSFFTESMNQEVSRRLTLEEQMHGALDRAEFWLVYQPLIDVSNGNYVGVEALLRWTNPVLGEVLPDEFIPIAEQTGLIVPIGQFVLNEALSMAAKWQKDCMSQFRIAVNLSPRQFRDPNLVNFIEKTLSQTRISAKNLELEITEGVLMSGHSFIDDALTALGHMGTGLALDDFGTGYSSMSYLRKYPFDTLKIDRSFINDLTVDPADRELVNATIAMAHALGLKVVAEGVETVAQFAHLAEHKCEFAQGRLFSIPVSPEKITEMLKNQNKPHDNKKSASSVIKFQPLTPNPKPDTNKK